MNNILALLSEARGASGRAIDLTPAPQRLQKETDWRSPSRRLFIVVAAGVPVGSARLTQFADQWHRTLVATDLGARDHRVRIQVQDNSLAPKSDLPWEHHLAPPVRGSFF